MAFPASRLPLHQTLHQTASRFLVRRLLHAEAAARASHFFSNKALIHIVVFAAIIVGLSSDPGDGGALTLSLLLAGFIFYMAFDAMRTARAKSLGESTADPLEAWSKNRPVGPIILIALGALFLLNNFDWFPFHFIWRLWPLILIGVGILLFRNRLSNRA